MSKADIEKIRKIAMETAAKITCAKLGTAAKAEKNGASAWSSDDTSVKRTKKTANGAAIEELIAQAEKDRKAGVQSEARITCIEVPNSVAGMVIGKQGKVAKHYEEHYGVYLHCRHSELNEETQMMPFALVGGTVEAQQQVASAIKDMIEKRTGTILTDDVEIPDRFVGFVVGRQGVFLRALQDKVGIRTSLNQEKTVNDTKVLTLKSTSREKIESARYILDRQILEAHRRSGVYNAPLETQFAEDTRAVSEMLGLDAPPRPHVAIEAEDPSCDVAPPGASLFASVAPHGPSGPQNQLGFGTFADSEHMAVGRVNPMEVDAVEGSESYYQAVMQWAACYAREPSCVEYYTSLRSHAAQAFRDGELVGQFGGA